jgi:hypothetical protein
MTTSRLFLSYARHDDEAFVARLHDDLAALGFQLWWDRRCMPNRGLTFLREIRDAIVGAGRLLFVFGPSAAQSDYVRAEWQYACSIGTPVMTVLRLGEYDELPEALRHFDVLDFRQEEQYQARLATLVRQLDQPISPLGRLIGVPELPAQFQARAADMAAIRAALLRDSHAPVVLTAAGHRVGIQGMGGIGKSILAAAVVREVEVRRAFPDGLVWVTLGPNPNLLLRLAGVCRALGDPPQSFADAEQGRARFAALLADRASLLVLDDAWQLEHVGAFEALGPHARHYLELAVFPQGVSIPETAVRTLWGRAGGLNPRTADKLIATLARRALIRLSGQSPRRSIQLHDLQHDYARAAAGDLTVLHMSLLDAYRGTFSGDWHHGPNDGCFFQHLALHLAGAKHFDALSALLTASPAWMEAQFSACTGDSQFAADLDLVLGTPIGQRPLGRIAVMAAQRVVQRRVEAYSDTSLETLAYLGRSHEALSHARLRPEPSQRVRALVRLNRVLQETNELHEDLLGEALALVPQLQPGHYWEAQAALSDLSLALFEAGRAAEALEVANLAKSDADFYSGGDGLVTALAEQQRFADAAAVARMLSNDRLRVQELLRVARSARDTGMHAFAKELTAEAISEIRAAVDQVREPSGYSWDRWRTEAAQEAFDLVGSEDGQSRELRSEALEIILRSSEDYRDDDLKEIAIKLSRLGETELVLRAIAGSSYPDLFRTRELPGIARAAAEAAQFDTALAITTIIEKPALRAQSLAAMLLPMHEARDSRIDQVISEALAQANRIEAGTRDGRTSPYGSSRAQTLCMLAEILSRRGDPRVAEILDHALLDAREQGNYWGEAEAVAAVAQSMIRVGLAETARPLLAEALSLAGKNRESFSASAVRNVVEQLAKAGASEFARLAVNSIHDPDARDWALCAVAESLAARDPSAACLFFQEALANRSRHLNHNLLALSRALNCWTPGLIEQALSCVGFVESSQYQLDALQRFLPGLVTLRWISACEKLIETATRLALLGSLAGDLTKQCEQALHAGDFEMSLLLARNIADDTARPAIFARVAIAMAEDGEPRALDVARSAVGESRSRALEAVALARAKAGDPEAGSILEEMLAGDRAHVNVSHQDAAVRHVAGALARLGAFDAALAALNVVVGERERVNALADIASDLLHAGCLDRALRVAGAVGRPVIRARALLVLSGVSSDPGLLHKALVESQLEAAPSPAECADWISALCVSAAKHAVENESLGRTLLGAACTAIARISDRGWRSKQQAFLARAITGIGWFDDALMAARAVEDERDLDYGLPRGLAVASVAEAMARAGRESEARATAAEADRICTEAVDSALSLAQSGKPPDGYESQHRRRIEELVAERGAPEPETETTERPDVASGAPQPTPPPGEWDHLAKVPDLEDFLVALTNTAPVFERESADLGRACLKEATRVAGWISPAWRTISGSIFIKPEYGG